MKKFTLLMALPLLFLFGCAKEEMTPTIDDNKQLKELSAFVYNVNGDDPTWEHVTLDEAPSSQNNSGSLTTRSNNGNSGHAHGDFPGVVFSGTQNNGGPHGSATVSLGPHTYTCETECVMVDGNEAVYGGTITEVSGPPPGPGPPVYSPGDHVYFKVFDNGQGNNADPDQFYGRIKFSSSSQCGIWTPSNAEAWPPTFICCGLPFPISLINDIPEPGSVKVNN